MLHNLTEKQLAVIDTTYEHYEIVERHYEGRSARVLFSGQRRAAQSGVALDDNPDLLFDYNQRLLELANALYPKTILVIGGGAFTLPTALLTALPDAHITVVELDPELGTIAAQYFGLVDDERLQIVYGDGRHFLETTTKEYDLIIIDVFSELHIPKDFLTVEANNLYLAHVSARGSVALNIIASYQGRNAGLIKSQVAAYSKNFKKVTVYPAAHGLTSWLPQNLLLVAERQPKKDLDEYIRFAHIKSIEAADDDVLYDSD